MPDVQFTIQMMRARLVAVGGNPQRGLTGHGERYLGSQSRRAVWLARTNDRPSANPAALPLGRALGGSHDFVVCRPRFDFYFSTPATNRFGVTDEVYQRGLRFLLKAQLDDGSWHVQTRSKAFQKYFESGFPHGKDQFVSISASCWATMALILTSPPADDGRGNTKAKKEE